MVDSLRPKEKLIRYGPAKLAATDLLALLIWTGQPGHGAEALAKKLLRSYPLPRLNQLTYADLISLNGFGPRKAAAILAAIELGRRLSNVSDNRFMLNPKSVWLALADIRDRRKEHCVAFYLDGRHQLIKQEVISIGTVNASLVHPREVFEPAIRYLASQVIVAHNHPSNQLEPSADDILMTERLIEAGKILGIELVDHVIVGRQGYYSLKSAGQLPADSTQ